ncbi:uncharacterized protein LOC105435426 isoform X1 [Cucumis sativus]|uniref:uncharacterized protein LOC105435426 isoform X1 n=1 Tax=Cucumis sativus TaxID=3659 RepID=UPI0005EC8FE0|nr:uncharacterized protein LOC105435426 isoform X1 [Cucumis sativus]
MEFRDLRSFQELKVIYKEQEERVCHHDSKVQNLVIGYLIFGRLLIFVTMLRRAQYQLDIIREELIEICQRILETQNQKELVDLTQLTMEAGESNDGFDYNFGFHKKMLMLDHSSIVRRKVHMYFTVSVLLVVIVIELYVSKYLVCN